jgi:hypothetical protein
MIGTPENTLRSPFLGGQKIDHKYMYFDGHREISKSSKKNILEPGVLGRVSGHVYVWDIREDRTWPRIR